MLNLTLTRHPGEALIIEIPAGEQMEVTALVLKGSQARISTDAGSVELMAAGAIGAVPSDLDLSGFAE